MSSVVPRDRLRIGIHYNSVSDLPASSVGPRGTQAEIHRAVADAGYEGLQAGDPDLCSEYGLTFLGSGLLTQPADAETLAAQSRKQGSAVVTCIAGYGMESDDEMDAYASAICQAAAVYELPLLLETHRASITQDAWRTVNLAERFPMLRFNLDLSHWFTGQEMPYGDMDARIKFLEPILTRTRYIHGRIGNRCCMQVPLADAQTISLPTFKRVWTRVMQAFLSSSCDSGSHLWFCPELLGPTYDYARTFRDSKGDLLEESDRWQEASALVTIARQCFENAKRFSGLMTPSLTSQ